MKEILGFHLELKKTLLWLDGSMKQEVEAVE